MKYRFLLIPLLFCISLVCAFGFWPFDGEKDDNGKASRTESSVKTKTTETTSLPAPTRESFVLDKKPQLVASFAPIIKRVSPNVVSVLTVKNTQPIDQPFPFFNDPSLKNFFGPGYEEEDGFPAPAPSPYHRDREIGSGVIVGEDGTIVTNYHVIENAEEITVSFAGEGEKDISAKVVGVDPKTDLAVLKIERDGLTPVNFGDSDHVEVGDLVLAIGNPFGLSQTVTMGIVSGLSRDNVGIVRDGYEDFIQTDASINPGNSGGALVDSRGKVIGINTAIYSQSGGNQGIGFAVPINFVRAIVEQIVNTGRVIRGYLGISIQPLSKELAQAFQIPEDYTGALIGEVTEDSPADKAGLIEGDVIVRMNGEPVSKPHQLRLTIAQTKPGATIQLGIIRDGKEKAVPVVLEELPEAAPSIQLGQHEETAASTSVLDGIEITNLTPEMQKKLNIPDNIHGALIKDVLPTSTAYEIGLRPGDVVMDIDRQPIQNAEEALKISEQIQADRVILRIWRNTARYIVLPLGGGNGE